MEIERLSDRLGELIADDARLERVATGFQFTEGPLWDPEDESLLFSDIPADRIYRWCEGAEAGVFREPSGKSNGLTWDLRGHLLACEHLNRRVSRTVGEGVVPVCETFGGRRLNSPNDLVVHSSGGIYFSDPPYGIESERVGRPAEREQPLNGLYLLQPGAVEPVLLAEDFDRPNGLAFSPDEALLYVADTPRLHVRVFHREPDGTLSGGQVFAQFSAEQGEGRPDGMKVDTRGNLWTTGPGGVWIVAPDGEILGRVRLSERGANCAWGDGDYRTLYITASTSIYRIRSLIPGVAPRRA
jgi:gluconolactonase